MSEASNRLLQYTGAAAAAVGMLALSAVVASSAAVGAVAGSIHAGKNIFKDILNNQKESPDSASANTAPVPIQSAETEA